ncbi:WGR and DUF4132 domain-containing protein [Ottowia testudinis]|uniref:DUF4132 domain-containing protein n=1 Tax=Ottowia testudinis TaxID=2816950 RepID=A0A975H735_9BURK|nr:WGR and DUF4132 domain-containing protein [Ottowia testudinis]QTD46622.1 DUF4132 domain-containing protein [Ottowia testudinis]
MQRYELIEGKSAKFWEVQAEGADLTIRFGRIGTNGQTQTKTFADAAAALKERDKLIKEKTGKGYAEVSVAANAALAKVASKMASAPAESAQAATKTEAVKPTEPTAAAAPPTAVAAPASVVAGAGTQPPVDPSTLDWPPERIDDAILKKAIAPVLRGEQVPPFEASTALLDKIPELEDDTYQRSQPTLDAMAQALGQQWRFWGKAGGRACLTRERLSQPDPAYWREACAQCLAHWHWRSAAHEWIVKTGVVLHGIGFMLDTLLPLAQAVPHEHKVRSALEVLRHAIAAASQENHDAALLIAARVRQTRAEAGFICAFLFAHHQPWVDEALAQAKSDKQCWLLTCAMSPQQMVDYLHQSQHYLYYLYPTLQLQVARHGVRAMPVLELLLSHASDKSSAESMLEWIAAVQCPAQIGALVRQMEGAKETRALLDKVAESHPAATLYTAIDHLATHRLSMLQGWTLRLAARHPQALAQALAALEPAVAQAFTARLAALDVKEAGVDALPALLQNPPWLQKLRPQALPTLEVIPLPVEPRVEWTDSEIDHYRPMPKPERWLQDRLEKLAQNLGNMEAAVFRQLGINDQARTEILAGRAVSASDLTLEQQWSRPFDHLIHLPPGLALRVWNEYPVRSWTDYGDSDAIIQSILATHGQAALPGLLAYCKNRPEWGLPLATAIDATGIASIALHSFRNVKKSKAVAQDWIARHPRTTSIVALQEAFGTDKAARDNGAFGLRWLMRHGHEALIDEIAAEYGASTCPDMPAALTALKSADPLNVLPAKMPRLPPFFSPATFTRPQLKTGGALPVSAAEHIGTMLAISKLEAPYPGLDIVREVCTLESLAGFSWDLFDAWMAAGAPAKEAWAFHALGHLGNNDTVRGLTPKIREWPGEAAHARAVLGLDLLTLIGTDLALMSLNAIANKVKFKGLQERAREKIAAIADARGLSTDELADRLVPDLGLDESGALALDFGPRQFSVAFDESLKPFVRDAQGARLKDLPKPIKSDDAEKANAATARYKQLKKDAKAIASMQVTRLELAMTGQRRWSSNDFKLFFLQHPVMRFLATRLVWAVYRDGIFTEAFRVAEDFTLADRHDAGYTLAADASVGIAHVLEMSADEQADFGQILADYEILQPFRQLGRETYALTPHELAANAVTRFAGKTVSVGSLMGLINRGWERGDAQDGGWVGEFIKPAGDVLCLVAELEPGLVIGDLSYEPKQHVKAVTLCSEVTWDHSQTQPLSQLNPIAASEMLRDLDLLAPYQES